MFVGNCQQRGWHLPETITTIARNSTHVVSYAVTVGFLRHVYVVPESVRPAMCGQDGMSFIVWM